MWWCMLFLVTCFIITGLSRSTWGARRGDELTEGFTGVYSSQTAEQSCRLNCHFIYSNCLRCFLPSRCSLIYFREMLDNHFRYLCHLKLWSSDGGVYEWAHFYHGSWDLSLCVHKTFITLVWIHVFNWPDSKCSF